MSKKFTSIVVSLLVMLVAFAVPSSAQKSKMNAKMPNSVVAKAQLAKKAQKQMRGLATPKPLTSSKLATPGQAMAKPEALRNQGPLTTALPLLYGHAVYGDSWYYDGSEYGVYSIIPAPPANLELVFTHPYLEGAYGGAYIDGVYYVHYVYQSLFGTYFERDVYDMATGNLLDMNMDMDITDLAICSSLDANTGISYGYFYNSDEDSAPTDFCAYNYVTAERTLISTTEKSFLACAADGKGYVYAISSDGDLYKVDCASGSETLIGNTGLAPAYMQSAAIDPATGRCFWAFCSDIGALYELNLETAEATFLFMFDDNEEICNLQVIGTSNVDDQAPAMVENLTASFSPENPYNVVVSFTLPTVNIQEAPLTGNVGYTIKVGENVVSGEGQPGENITATIENLAAAMYAVEVTASNAEGSGRTNVVNVWIGPDTPLAPTNVNLNIDENGLATVTWDAVTLGVHGGYVNPAEVTYKVIRYPGEVVVAEGLTETTFSETVDIVGLNVYYYEVVAVYGETVSEAGATNSVQVGTALEPPYEYAFDGTQDALWTVLDVNGDGSTWSMSTGYASYVYNQYNQADDWLLSPLVHMLPGKIYLVSFDVYAYSSSYPERFEVGVGQGEDVADYDFVVDPTDVTWTDPSNVECAVKVDEEGYYHVGIHAISDADKWRLLVSNFKISAPIDGGAPGEVTNVVFTAGEMGALSGTLTFNAPSENFLGEALDEVTKIEVKRDGQLIATIENPAVGSEQTVEDADIPEGGDHEYAITSFNSKGQGATVKITGFVGPDAPADPTNVMIVDNGDGTVTMSWDPITSVGANGGYVDVSEVQYIVMDVTSDGYLGDTLSVQTETSFVNNTVNIDEMAPSFYRMVVQARTSGGASSMMLGYIVAGRPESLPFSDGFELVGQSLKYFWSITSPATSSTNWNITESFDTDGTGVGGYYSAYADGDEGYLWGPRIDFTGAAAPKAVFKYMIVPGSDIELALYYDRQDGNGVQKLADVVPEGEGIQTAVVDMSALIGVHSALIGWYAKANTANSTVYVDELKIGDVYAEDLAVEGVSAPRSALVGETVDVNVTVVNHGSNDVEAGAYSVKLYAGDKVVAETAETPALVAYFGNGIVTLPFTAAVTDASPTTLKAEVVYNKDLEPLNNFGQTTINVRQNNVATVNDLAAFTTGWPAVQLTWGEPVQGGQTEVGEPITEDFEDQDVFVDGDWGGIDFGTPTGKIGGWTVYDGDQQYDYGWQNVTIPGGGYPKAFQVFQPGIYFDLTSGQLVPYSGDQYMLALNACGYDKDENQVDPQTDDWLISPELAGVAQTISFFVTEITDQYGHESYQVLYSSTDTNPESFELLLEGKASVDWEEISVDLPAGAKYFAIRCVSHDIFGLMVDDITYIPTATVAAVKGADLEVTGYNIYRDGEKIATVGADVHEFLDVNETDGVHYYNVTVLYGDVESPLSNTVGVVTAIEELQTVQGLNDADITVYGTNGAIVASGKGVFSTLRRGVYVIKNNETGAVQGVSKK